MTTNESHEEDGTTIEERLADVERRESTLLADRVRHELGQALAPLCIAEGLQDAVQVMSASSTFEFDANGRIAKIKMGGKEYAGIGTAVTAFLEPRSHLIQKRGTQKTEQKAIDSGS